MRKLIVLLEAFALAAVTLTAITINPQTVQMIVAASQAANGPQESALRSTDCPRRHDRVRSVTRCANLGYCAQGGRLCDLAQQAFRAGSVPDRRRSRCPRDVAAIEFPS
jgi:hypothetical protein